MTDLFNDVKRINVLELKKLPDWLPRSVGLVDTRKRVLMLLSCLIGRTHAAFQNGIDRNGQTIPSEDHP